MSNLSPGELQELISSELGIPLPIIATWAKPIRAADMLSSTGRGLFRSARDQF